ncbi:MAG: hypothetical protein ACYC3X_01245 [Pirellulaceae bacterium]
MSRYEWFGGFAYRPPFSGAGVLVSDALIWLNGQQVDLRNKLEGYQRVPVAKRRGWHERFAWHDAVLVDLPLQPGENHLVVTLHKQARKSWFNSVRLFPQPASALWPLIEEDFPRSSNRLLEVVDARWFDAVAGWLPQGQTPQFERELVEDLARKLGPDGAAILGRLDALVKAAAPATDAGWLDLCVTAAELHAALGQVNSLRAAVEQLATAYPHEYPGAGLLGHIAGLRDRLLTADRLDPAEEPTVRLLTELEDLQHEALVEQNPLLVGKRLLFVKRFAYDSDHYYDEFITGTRAFGGGLFTLSLDDGTVTPVTPALSEGVVDRYDLSRDARRIVFDYKRPRPEGFRVPWLSGERRCARPDGGYQPVRPFERQGVARRGPGAGRWVGLFHGACREKHLLSGAGRGLHGGAADRTFVNFLAGEQRSCIGCHEQRNLAPTNRHPLALDSPPAVPQPQPGETAPRPLHYPTDIQPIFDRHCVSCHNAQKPDSKLDLTGDMTELFCRSYEEIIGKDLVGYIQEFVGPKPEAIDATGYAPAVPPYTYGSHKSKLIGALRAGHYDVKLPREDFIRLVTWVDANAPYYGSYFGRRNIAYRDRPDFRPVPTLESALGTPPESH